MYILVSVTIAIGPFETLEEAEEYRFKSFPNQTFKWKTMEILIPSGEISDTM